MRTAPDIAVLCGHGFRPDPRARLTLGTWLILRIHDRRCAQPVPVLHGPTRARVACCGACGDHLSGKARRPAGGGPRGLTTAQRRRLAVWAIGLYAVALALVAALVSVLLAVCAAGGSIALGVSWAERRRRGWVA